MSDVLAILRAAKLLRLGITRLFIVTCHTCGKRNRVDRWRILFGRAITANCGYCKTPLARRVKGKFAGEKNESR